MKLLKGLGIAFCIMAILFSVVSLITGDYIINAISAVLLILGITMVYEYKVKAMQEQRDIYRKGYLQELQRNTMIIRNTSGKLPESINYIHLN